MITNKTDLPKILYDGHCEFCRRSIYFIDKHGGSRSFEYVPLQSEYGKKILRQIGLPEDYLDSVLLVSEDLYRHKSDAILHIFRKLNRPWNFLFAFRIIPKRVRDRGYDFISYMRKKKWVQKLVSCKQCGNAI